MDELALALRVSTRTVQRMVARGELVEGQHYLRVSRQLRFREAAVLAAMGPTAVASGHRAISTALSAQLE
jgi:hypothetical protein